MCNYSLENYKSRDAIENETLVANNHFSGHSGTLTAGGGQQLVCVKHETKLTVEDMRFGRIARFYKSLYNEHLSHDADFHRGFAEANSRMYRSMLEGKRHVVTMLDGGKIAEGYDFIEFENGVVIGLSHIERGTRFIVGVKPTLEEKLQLDEKSLRAIAADDPKPKPDDDDAPEDDDDEKKKVPDGTPNTGEPTAGLRHLVYSFIRGERS